VAYSVRDLVLTRAGRWDVAVCAACGHVQLAPAPDDAELRDLYETLYTPENLEIMRKVDRSGFDRRLRERRVALLAAHADAPARLLDLGCGLGAFLSELSDRFPEAEAIGIELAEPAARDAERRGLTVLRERVQDVHLEPVDVLSMNHLLEHVGDPVGLLRDAAEHLRPGGLLLVEVPKGDSWGRALFGRWWWPHLPPQHLHLFTAPGLRKAVESAGFEVLEERFDSYPGTFTASLIFCWRFLFGSESRFRANWFVRGPMTLLGLFLMIDTVLLDLVVGTLLARSRWGDIVTLVARKR